jgi:hypothetical protein
MDALRRSALLLVALLGACRPAPTTAPAVQSAGSTANATVTVTDASAVEAPHAVDALA